VVYLLFGLTIAMQLLAVAEWLNSRSASSFIADSDSGLDFKPSKS